MLHPSPVCGSPQPPTKCWRPPSPAPVRMHVGSHHVRPATVPWFPPEARIPAWLQPAQRAWHRHRLRNQSLHRRRQAELPAGCRGRLIAQSGIRVRMRCTPRGVDPSFRGLHARQYAVDAKNLQQQKRGMTEWSSWVHSLQRARDLLGNSR